jgi:ribosomal-protein-alanine N-acetyltransferase
VGALTFIGVVDGMSGISSPDKKYSIQPATWRDLNSLRQVEQACFPVDVWPLWDLIGVLTMPNVVRLKAVVDERMVGFIAGDMKPVERMAWIVTLGVLPEYRRLGIGAALLRACESQITFSTIRLNVRISNRAAINLYESFGYQKVGRWPGYYQDGEEALIMEKQRGW